MSVSNPENATLKELAANGTIKFCAVHKLLDRPNGLRILHDIGAIVFFKRIIEEVGKLMNWIFFFLIASAYAATVWQQWQWSIQASSGLAPMHSLTEQLLQSANDAVVLVIGLIGVLALFLGLLKILEEGGLLQTLARVISPLLSKLFPEIPANHPAMGAMMMTFSANLLGVGNAATPFGLKAMQELDKLNPHPGIATNAMVLFLAINTSGLTLLPTKVIALRVSSGSTDPAGIVATTLFATIVSTTVAIVAAKFFQRFSQTPSTTPPPTVNSKSRTRSSMTPLYFIKSAFVLIGFISLFPLVFLWGKYITPWIIPSLIITILSFGLFKKIDIYSSFTEGAKEGFEIAIKIIPYLVAIFVAISMFRASGLLNTITKIIGSYTSPLGLPPEALPMVLMRPLSGSGSLGVLSDILNNPAIGPDSYTGYLVSTMMGSTETTFYVIAIYFGAIKIKKIRHAIAAGLTADLAGVIASIIAVKMFLFS